MIYRFALAIQALTGDIDLSKTFASQLLTLMYSFEHRSNSCARPGCYNFDVRSIVASFPIIWGDIPS